MTESRLLEENKRAHFMTKRFDRDDNKKIHMQTLCALAHFDYNDSSSYSYEQAFQIMHQLKLPYKEIEQLFLRMVFNVVARNQDDHTKNISFLMDETGKWKLAPAYDMTFAYDPDNIWMKAHQLSINGKNNEIEKADVLHVAKEMSIKKAEGLIENVNDSVRNWRKHAKDAGVDSEQIKSIAATHNFL